MPQTIVDPLDQLGNRSGLITRRLVIGMELEQAFRHEGFLMAAARRAAKSQWQNRHLV